MDIKILACKEQLIYETIHSICLQFLQLLNYDFQTDSMDELFNLDKQYFIYFHYMQFIHSILYMQL